MKKLISMLAIALISVGSTFAQTAPAKKVEKKATVQTVKSATPVKKDGTADMRFKANKEAAKKVAGPTKKDGTPDMRYKANQKTPAKKP